MIPTIPLRDILADTADRAILQGASQTGFLSISGADAGLDLAQDRATLMAFFDAPEPVKRRIIRHKYDPTQPNIYRGYFVPEPHKDALLEGIDLGPDVADPARAGDGRDPLTEPTPLPDLPGWAEAAGRYHSAMTRLGLALARALLRALGAQDTLATQLFANGISTLRLFRYPETEIADLAPRRRLPGEDTRALLTLPHTDSGFITLLWQDTTGGLQAQMPDETWIDVPPTPGGLVVNFGQMLCDWSGGKVRATPHRVLAGPQARISVPFFLEPAADATIDPLPGTKSEPFIYGDFLWSRMTNFPNFAGVTRRPATRP